MSGPTLLEDLEYVASRAVCERGKDCPGPPCDVHETAARLRAHATRLRDEMATADECERTTLGKPEHAWFLARQGVLRAINGGASPPITPGSPGGGNVCVVDGCAPERCPATRPTTPTCASWCGSHNSNAAHDCWSTQVDGFCFCSVACRDAGRPLHPRTP
jgi:hypothetical protein